MEYKVMMLGPFKYVVVRMDMNVEEYRMEGMNKKVVVNQGLLQMDVGKCMDQVVVKVYWKLPGNRRGGRRRE